jgi:STE24 endopeptidase
MTETTLFFMIISITCFEFFLLKYIGYLNTLSWSEALPPELEDIYDAEKYDKSQKYEKEKYRFWLVISTASFLIMMLMLLWGGFGILDSFVRTFSSNSVVIALIFFGSISLFQTFFSLPFSYYSTFVIEEKYGFNKMTKKLFFIDTLKSLLLSAIIWGAIVALIVWIYSIFGAWFWIYAWTIVTIFTVFMIMFYSSLIVPLFNKQTPLEKGELKTAIENFAKKVGFQLDNIYVIDGSKRSSKANAYFSGLGPKKRIVLYDTLINDLTTPQLVAVLAHEIGHYKRKHTLQMFAFSFIQTGMILFILSLALSYEPISLALGTTEGSFHVGLVAFGVLFTPLSLLLGIGGNMLSRRNEYQADAYAKQHTGWDDLAEALKQLSRNNLSNLKPHPVYEFFHYSHPTVLKRLQVLENNTRSATI